MKINIYFNTQRTTKEGDIPIMLSISHNSKRFYVNTELRTKTPFEDGIFPRSEKNHKAKTMRLNQIVDEVENIIITNSTQPIDVLKRLIKEKVFGQKAVANDRLCVVVREYAQTRNKRTKEIYEQTANKLERLMPNATLDVDCVWLEDFYTLLRQTLAINTCGIHLRNIRASFRWAIKHKRTSNYPFADFKIEKEETAKRDLSIDDIRYIRDASVSPSFERYRDLFMLMFYLIGINGKDILTARKEQLVNGRLFYQRAKTLKQYSIKVEPEALALIHKYQGEHYLLSFHDHVKDYTSIMKHLNETLDAMITDVTSYYARHSWATIAYSLDIPIDVISQSLGHSRGSKVTATYIHSDPKKVDDANRKVLDAIL